MLILEWHWIEDNVCSTQKCGDCKAQRDGENKDAEGKTHDY